MATSSRLQMVTVPMSFSGGILQSRTKAVQVPFGAVQRPVAEQPEAAAVVVLDPVVVAAPAAGCWRACRLPLGRGRHHSSAMRSGPSTRTMRWAWRRQMELTDGGSSGIAGHDLDRLGPLQQPRRARALHRRPARCQAPAAADRAGRRRPSARARADGCRAAAGARRSPRPAARPAGRRDRSCRPRPGRPRSAPVSGSASCVPLQVSTSGAARIISSTPKPGSSSPSFSSKSFISMGLSRLGRLVPMARAIDRAVDAIERDLEPARADACLLELPAEGGQQAAGRGGDVLGPADRLDKGEPRAEGGRRAARLDAARRSCPAPGRGG